MSKWNGLGFYLLVAAINASACSSDEATGGSAGRGGGTATTGGSANGSGGATATGPCGMACQKLVAKSCGDLVGTNCQAECVPDEACPTELDAYYSCIAGPGVLSCSGAVTQVAGCDAQGTAYTACTSCAPAMGDTTCGTCTKTSCCGEVKAYNTAADIDGFDACLTPCVTQACVDTCAATYPVAGAAFAAAIACQDRSCQRPCICGVQTTDSACLSCIKANCCDALIGYNTANNVEPFANCIQPCTTQACIDACVTQFPEAGAAYNNVVTSCVNTTCATACSAQP